MSEIPNTTNFQQQKQIKQEKFPQLHPSSASDVNLKHLKQILTKWVSQTIAGTSLKPITDLTADLADGQIIGAFLEGLTGDHIVEWKTTTSEKGKIINMITIVKYLQQNLNILESDTTWTRFKILERDHSSILLLLVELVHAIGINLNLPSNVTIAVIKSVHIDGVVKNKTNVVKITGDESIYSTNENANTNELSLIAFDAVPDVFDDLVDTTEKLNQVEFLLIEFCNEKLSPLNMEVTTLIEDFEDGIKLIILTGIIGNVFLPLPSLLFPPVAKESEGEYPDSYRSSNARNETESSARDYNDDLILANRVSSKRSDGSANTKTAIRKLENIKFAFSVMSQIGIDTVNFNPADFVKGNIKGVMRCVYALFAKSMGDVPLTED